jgi:glutathione synthase/RimK-type ligase-like ATP-grasp enzyme
MIAIHHRRRGFSTRWIEYCEQHAIPYKMVDCLDSGILEQLRGVDALLWSWGHADAADRLVARSLILAAESMGLLVFPDTATCWHFDDKIAQKFLLEAVGAPLVPVQVFYQQGPALQWISSTSFPKVFKLRSGAGSSNVRLVKTARQAANLVKRAFGPGFSIIPGYRQDIAKRIHGARKNRNLLGAIRRLPATIKHIRSLNRGLGREKGYVYFQDFVPGNEFDTRITIIGERAFAFTRDVRPGDFRASGSGRIVYDVNRIDPRCIEIAFDVARKAKSQSMAFDFVNNAAGEPLILEVSYCYDALAVYNCTGHWDSDLKWHEGSMWPQDAILMNLLAGIRQRKQAQNTRSQMPSR